MVTSEISDDDEVDVSTQLLIAQLLDEELNDMSSAHLAESLQMGDALRTSSLSSDVQFEEKGGDKGKPKTPIGREVESAMDEDFQLAHELLAQDARISSDAALAAKMQLDNDASIMSDAEFARKIQDADENGFDIDDPKMKDADRVLGKDAVDRILATDPNSKGKGKGKGRGSNPPSMHEPSVVLDFAGNTWSSPHHICGICMEPFQQTNSPVSASGTATSSNRVQFGLHLPCPGEHGYCLSCMSSYIKNKLDPNGDGSGISEDVRVFPIPCPECLSHDWPAGIQVSTAERVLGDKGLLLWHHQKLLDSLPRYYCPNPRCSILLQVDDDSDDPQAECPACSGLLCVPCKAVWHDGMTCEEYQAIPMEDRSPDDLLTLQAIKAKNWRRCPSCSVIIIISYFRLECSFNDTQCKTEFCFKCGALWDKRQQRCTSDPACALWDEDMLFEDRERERQRLQLPPAAGPARLVAEPPRPRLLGQGAFAGPAAVPMVHAPLAAPPPPYNAEPPRLEPGEFDWVTDPGSPPIQRSPSLRPPTLLTHLFYLRRPVQSPLVHYRDGTEFGMRLLRRRRQFPPRVAGPSEPSSAFGIRLLWEALQKRV
ncbi:hypothetical protein EW146_g4847 [Bondarzewia mesenterica]|uniref:RBR-type E3 ubiquitin transferase n=1 Tax=Bondarzewia mesenterica TaxID=1095465 RepID=A0A4S4LVC4_9AGAM|nr:hypothetical protein EW146_g4847 [Bondarzewia mesenterica]